MAAWFVVAFLFCFDGTALVEAGYNALALAPEDTISIASDIARLQCRTVYSSTSVWWKHRPVGSSAIHSVYEGLAGLVNGYATAQRYNIDSDESIRRYDLVISGVQTVDAGTYFCIDQDGLGLTSQAELIVLNDATSCSSSNNPNGVITENSCGLQPDLIQMNCSARFTGNIRPKLVWTYKEKVPFETHSTESSVYSYLEITAADNMDWRSYACEMKLNNRKINTCQPIKQEVKTISLSERKSLVFRTDRPESVKCQQLNSTSDCNHVWITDDNTEQLVASGPTLNLTSPGKFRCKAECNIRGTLCTYYPMTVQYYMTESDGSQLSLIIGATLCSAVVLTALLVFLLYRTRTKRNESTTINDINPQTFSVVIENPPKRFIKKLRLKSFTIWKECLFIIFENCKTISVHKNQEPFDQVKLLEIETMISPEDISACEKFNCLYVSDSGARCIWKITLPDLPNQEDFKKVETRFLTDAESPYTLSVTPDGVIVKVKECKGDTGIIESSLILYSGENGEIIETIKVNCTGESPRHAVMKTRGTNHTFIVAFEKRIREVNESGAVLRMFPVAEEPGIPKILWSILLDTSGRVFLVDLDAGNILVQKTQWDQSAETINLVRNKKRVRKICYNDGRNQLFVALRSGEFVVHNLDIDTASANCSHISEKNDKEEGDDNEDGPVETQSLLDTARTSSATSNNNNNIKNNNNNTSETVLQLEDSADT